MRAGYWKSTEYLQCVECQVCATLRPSQTLLRPPAFRLVKTSRRSSEIIGASCCFSGISLTNSENGARISKSGSSISNRNYQSTSRQNTLPHSSTTISGFCSKYFSRITRTVAVRLSRKSRSLNLSIFSNRPSPTRNPMCVCLLMLTSVINRCTTVNEKKIKLFLPN